MCNVTVVSARPSEVINNVIKEITVSGTVSDCQPVYSPSPNTPPSQQVVVDGAVTINGNTVTGTVTAVLQVPEDPTQSREWSVTLKGISDIPCGTEIGITAYCATDVDCTDSQTFTLNCDCPTIKLTKNDIDRQNCDENGNAEVIFTVALNNISENAFFAGVLHTGHFVDANEFTYSVFFPGLDSQGQNLWTQQQNGGWRRSFTHRYPVGDFSNIYLSSNLPVECAGNYLVEDAYENGTVRTPNCPSEDCSDSLTYSVTRVSDDDDVTEKVINSVCLESDLYKITILSPNNPGDSFTWSLNNNSLSAPITDDTNPNYPGVNGVNRSEYVHDLDSGSTASVSVAVIGGECVTPGAITLFGCGGNACEETAWSEWSECNNCTQIRTRTLSDCSQEMETRQCTSTPTNWSNWFLSGFCVQLRTRMNENCQNEVQSRIDWCCVWMWATIGLIGLTAVVALVTFCMLPISIVAGAFTLGTLTAINIGFLIASAVLAVLSLVILILWLIFCVFLNTNDASCFLLNRFIDVMGFLVLISGVAGLILSGIAALCFWNVVCLFEALGCAAGAWIDFAWFSSILGIAVVTRFFLCPSNG